MPLSTMQKYGATGTDMGGIIDQLRFTEGIEIAVFMYELPDCSIKGSLRSVNRIDVNVIANCFGGGGHVRAAGCTMEGSFYDVVNNLSEQIVKQLDEE